MDDDEEDETDTDVQMFRAATAQLQMAAAGRNTQNGKYFVWTLTKSSRRFSIRGFFSILFLKLIFFPFLIILSVLSLCKYFRIDFSVKKMNFQKKTTNFQTSDRKSMMRK